MATRADGLLTLTADIVSAHISHNDVPFDELEVLIAGVHRALEGLNEQAEAAAPAPQPAVPIRSSVKPGYLVCLEDGKKLKMLKRHLKATYGMTPDDYRAKWQLPADYPMVAPDYAATRRKLAEQAGLGRKPRAPEASVEPAEETPAPPVPQHVEIIPEPEPQLAPMPEMQMAEPPPVIPEATPPAPVQRVRRETLRLRYPAGRPVDATPESGAAATTGIVPSSDGGTAEGVSREQDIFCQATLRRMCVRATYNKRTVTLAPHRVFTRHGEPFIHAVTLDQDGKPPRELKIGTFKLKGLTDVMATPRPFVPRPEFRPHDPEFATTTICVLR